MLAAIAALAGLSGPAAAQVRPANTNNPPPPIADPVDVQLRALLSGYEFVPSATHFQRIGPRAEARLIVLAAARHEDVLIRARAASALVHMTGDGSRDALVALAADTEAPSVVRRKAVLSLAEIGGVAYLDLFVSVFTSADGDAPLREACARGFRTMGPDAYEARSELFRAERSPTVRALLRTDKAIE